MVELIKVIVELLALGDLAEKGLFSWLALIVGFAVTFVVGALSLPVLSYADKHPGPVSNKLLIGFLVFAALTFLTTVIWGWRYQKRVAARRAIQSAAPAVTTRT